ncbi:MAG: deoxyguanosinetriphosphate triphosphohydrolase, partial [Rhodoferax sp.]|nr:deoxyguanosinetriphosphate triphosphohydrolase [Rhodoferax sp.]
SIALKRFLTHALYRHPQVVHKMSVAQGVVRELFALYCANPQEMQAGFAARIAQSDRLPQQRSLQSRVVGDYIAGMTDRFAAREHTRLTGTRVLD